MVSTAPAAVKSGLCCLTHRLPLLQEFQKELSQWRKDPSGSKKKPKYSYKTVEELKAKGRISKKLAAPQKELSQVKVRGPSGRALGNTSNATPKSGQSPDVLAGPVGSSV